MGPMLKERAMQYDVEYVRIGGRMLTLEAADRMLDEKDAANKLLAKKRRAIHRERMLLRKIRRVGR